tara:strand:- start:1075 stop:1980 length:906 start_codon:yes stop_codon:yes gene_type:complete
MTEAEKRRKEIREALARSKKTGGTGFTKKERPGLGMIVGNQVTTDASGNVKIKRPAQAKKEAAKKPSSVPNLRKDRNNLNVTTPALGAATNKKSKAPDQVKNKPPKKTDPLAGKPRSIAAAKKAGQLYFFDKNGVKKLAVTQADLKKEGLTLRQYANKYAPKKVTKKEAEKFKIRKAGGGMMKKKGAKAGGAMKKKGAAGGGKMRKKMTAKAGGSMKKKMTAKAGGAMKKKMTARGGGAMKKKMYAGGGKMNKKMARAGGKMKKGYAVGGAMKKKGMKKGGKTMKMRGGGLATRGTTFSIR